jgi:uncharacterized membrane protein YfcA
MPTPELLQFAAAILAAGAFAGLLAGLFGVGGGIITVPVLYSVFKLVHVPPDTAIHVAVGTSLATIIPTSLSSLRAHLQYGAVDKDILRVWGPPVVIGSAMGGIVDNQLSGPALSLIFGIFAIGIAIFMGFAPMSPKGNEPPQTSPIAQRILAWLIGFVSAMVGVGGGSLSVPAMVLSRVPIHRAIGTSTAVGLLISLSATVMFLLLPVGGDNSLPGSFGHVNLYAFALLAPATMLTAPKGARLAHRLPAVKLRRIFAIFLLLIAARMIGAALR